MADRPGAPERTALGTVAALWGIAGVVALLIRPIVPLAGEAARSLDSPLTWVHWLFLGLWVPFMAWSEGYRGFHTRFAPRTAARAAWLAENPTVMRVLLAPLVCLALVHVRRSTLIARVILISAIVGIIVAVRLLPTPWRGLVDVGVVVGLGWGALSVCWFGISALRGSPPDYDLSLPGTPAPPRGRRGRQTE
ncbi:MAG: hypothetical protein KDA24_08425 [Deltaproteobacteria bacterium]|nr:hypothetical protein [Deltaproteobacteria bacterium]